MTNLVHKLVTHRGVEQLWLEPESWIDVVLATDPFHADARHPSSADALHVRLADVAHYLVDAVPDAT